VSERVEVTVFNNHLSDVDSLVDCLLPFEVVFGYVTAYTYGVFYGNTGKAIAAWSDRRL